jgi:hypothetical protein
MKSIRLAVVLLLSAIPFLHPAPAPGADPDRLERPGVTADRVSRTVRIEARATGVAPEVKTEFFLIAPNSGHDYEAVAVSKAIPSDVHAALEFIGLPPGRPVHRDALQYWPRGERVFAFIVKEDGSRIPLEDTILDLQTGKTLPRDGFVFTGSLQVPDTATTNEPPRMIYAADQIEPNSILSAFNLRTTVLDIPRLGTQTELYDRQVSHAGLRFEKDEALILQLEPEKRDPPTPRVLDLRMVVTGGLPDGTAQFELFDLATRRLAGPFDAESLQKDLQARQSGNRDVFLTFEVAASATLRQAAQGAEQVRTLLRAGVLKPEPPGPGQLYYSAFLPNPKLRQRELHPTHPWELRLTRVDASWKIRLTRIVPNLGEGGERILEEESFEPETPAQALNLIQEKGVGMPALLVIVPPDITYCELYPYLSPFQATHPHLFLFTE